MSVCNFYFLDYPETKILFKVLEEENINARFVGGCVRDSILGLENFDLDIAINRNIIFIEKILNQNGIKCIPTGIKYGSITAVINHKKFEITTLRKDEECFGRDCISSIVSSFEEDAKRRDFTINSLYVSLSGELFDYFGGVSDLKNSRVIFIGNPEKRIQEDYLRILRYYRFCAKFGDLSDRYHEVIKKNSSHIKSLSIERVQKELLLILDYTHASKILETMIELNVFKDLFKPLNLENFNKSLQIKCSLNAKIYLLFQFEDLIGTLKLSKAQKNLMKDYKNFEKEELVYCHYKKDFDFFNDIVVIKYAKFGTTPDFSQKFEEKKQFPLSFCDLPKGTKDANKKLKICEKWWIESNFQKTAEDCLKFIKNH